MNEVEIQQETEVQSLRRQVAELEQQNLILALMFQNAQIVGQKFSTSSLITTIIFSLSGELPEYIWETIRKTASDTALRARKTSQPLNLTIDSPQQRQIGLEDGE
jgi:predicted transcriptional regulator